MVTKMAMIRNMVAMVAMAAMVATARNFLNL